MQYGDPGFMRYSDKFVGSICPHIGKMVYIGACKFAILDHSCSAVCYSRTIMADIRCLHPRHPINLKIEDVVLEEL